MAYTTINKSTDYFNTKLFVGNSSTNAITGVGHQPDWTWIKRRDGGNGYSNFLFDAVRGVNKGISSNQTAAEITFNNGFDSFNSDGFTLGANTVNPSATELNYSGGNYASWNWKANGAGSANTDGGINSTVSVNNTAGFSIVKYGTGTGSATTVGHGMNTTPNFIIIKPLGTISAGSWIVGGDNIDSTWNNVLELNATAAKASDPSFNNTAPTSSVFSVGNNNTNRSGENYIAYCFADVQGFSKFGSYTGNGNANGPLVYTGFKPAFVMTKTINAVDDWQMLDNKRNGFNPDLFQLVANSSNAEQTSGNRADFLSNGFKLRTSGGSWNPNGGSILYMAFGQSLVGTNNIPNNAF